MRLSEPTSATHEMMTTMKHSSSEVPELGTWAGDCAIAHWRKRVGEEFSYGTLSTLRIAFGR